MSVEGDFSHSVTMLNNTVGDLKVAVAELKVTVSNMALRDADDRQAAQRREDRQQGEAQRREDRIAALERWKSRIQGQIWLIGGFSGLVGAAVIARILHWLP